MRDDADPGDPHDAARGAARHGSRADEATFSSRAGQDPAASTFSSRAGQDPAASTSSTPDCAHEPHAPRVPREASPPIVVERAAALFRALGDTARLSLLERLASGEYCVTELAEATGEGLSTISQRLRTLRSERLLRRRRVGKHVYYTLADHHVVDLIRSALEHAEEQH